MSKFGVLETTLCDEKYLVAALKEMGFTPEVHAGEGEYLYGYLGDQRAERAHVIIRRHQIGPSSNDIGFIKENGKYRAVVSEYDEARGFGQPWLNRVQQNYAEQRTLAVAKSKGYVLQGRTVESGRVKLLFGVR